MSEVYRPKPRRVRPSNLNTPSMFKPLIFSDDAESNPVAELLGPIHQEEDNRFDNLSLSPPFFFGSPPCRARNPLVHDVCFGVEKLSIERVSPKESAHAREHFGKKQVAVRVEGFDCSSAHAVAMA